MPRFNYSGRNSDGSLAEGAMDGSSADGVASQLLAQRITPVRIEEVREVKSASLNMNIRLIPEKVSLDDLSMFCRQMYALSRSGIPIVQAVSGLGELTRSDLLKETLRAISNRLRSGTSLASAMREHPRVFGDVVVSLVHVGENTGRMDDAFKKIIDHIELERNTKARISQALRYPSMVMGAMFVALGIINLFVIPSFSKVFAKLGSDLPLPTKILMTTSNFTLHYWWVVLGVLGGGFVAFFRYIKTPAGHLWWDRVKLKMPLLGPIFNKIALARFTRTFAMMSESGVPLVQGLGIVGPSIGNKYIESSISSIKRGVERGDSLTRSAAATGMFTPLILQMISVGEETGALDKLLHDVSDFYEQEVDADLKNLASAIEPIILVFMGGMVLVLALGVFLPMWNLGGAMKGHH